MSSPPPRTLTFVPYTLRGNQSHRETNLEGIRSVQGNIYPSISLSIGFAQTTLTSRSRYDWLPRTYMAGKVPARDDRRHRLSRIYIAIPCGKYFPLSIIKSPIHLYYTHLKSH